MNYEPPQVVELRPGIIAIQSEKMGTPFERDHDATPAYEDWE
jgi:hypothetical protein